MTEQEIRQQYPYGSVSKQVDDVVAPLTLEEYDQWVSDFLANELDADLHIGRT